MRLEPARAKAAEDDGVRRSPIQIAARFVTVANLRRDLGDTLMLIVRQGDEDVNTFGGGQGIACEAHQANEGE